MEIASRLTARTARMAAEAVRPLINVPRRTDLGVYQVTQM